MLSYSYGEASQIISAPDGDWQIPMDFTLIARQILLEAQLQRNQLELDQWFAPAPDIVEVAIPGMGVCLPWAGSDNELFVQSAWFVTTVASAPENWHRRWQLFQMRVDWAHEVARRLQQLFRLLKSAIALKLKTLARARFRFQIVCKQRNWYLLHGSHPPKDDTGTCGPVIAERGRVCCAQER
jgi:hypothetical protein